MEREMLFKKLQPTRVWIPCYRDEKGGISLELLVSAAGAQYLPAFYDRTSSLGKFSQKNLVQMEFQMLRNAFVDMPEEISGIVIEPFSENIALDRKGLFDYDAAVQGMTVKRNEHRGEVEFLVPDRMPKGLKAALRDFFRKQIGVNKAWAILAREKGEAEPHLLIAVDFFGNRIQLFPELAEVVRPFMQEGQRFELTEKSPIFDDVKFEPACIYTRQMKNV